MNYGFVIDNGSCIGCHACSTACKSENQVPVGVHRTWVKTTEAGVFPDVRRSFQVTRCNHCANPPCVRICPTQAMIQRDDGIVDFDGDACIGCKGCLQACPYDAIYLDPETRTAAKCHLCAHRLDVGLEPACVVVCPEHAIVVGDLDDPSSEISQKLARHNAAVRKPEQGTSPKVFYVEGNELALHPTAAGRGPLMAASDVDPHHTIGRVGRSAAPPRATGVDRRGTRVRLPDPQGQPSAGPIHVGGSMAEHMVQVAWNAQHKVPWHWPIPTYLVTKGIAGGAFALLAIAALRGRFDPLAMVSAGSLAVALTLVTLGLLVYDLDRPDRFLYLLFRPQWRSWIARAAWILTGFAAVTGLWWAAEVGAWAGVLPGGLVATVRPALAAAALPLSVLTAIYSAFLFAQAEGRDYWQSAHIAPLMAAQAAALGAGALVLFGPLLGAAAVRPARWVFAAALASSLALIAFGDLGTSLPSELARRAARDITHGRYRAHFLVGVGLGHLVPLALLAVPGAGPLAFVLAAVGLFVYLYAFVMAPQDIPNS